MFGRSRRRWQRSLIHQRSCVVRGVSVNSVRLSFLVEIIKLLDLRFDECQDQVVVLDSQDLVVVN